MTLLETRRIQDSEDFEDCAIEIFERFLSSFSNENGLTRDLTEDDPFDENDGVEFMYTQRGTRLAKRMLHRLHKVGEHYFPGEWLHIRTPLYVEP